MCVDCCSCDVRVFSGFDLVLIRFPDFCFFVWIGVLPIYIKLFLFSYCINYNTP
jgi:hypothetical protein